jgi:hypothetical protein
MKETKSLVESLFDTIYGKEVNGIVEGDIFTLNPNAIENHVDASNILPTELRDASIGNENIPTEPKQDRFWNGSIEQIKQLVGQVTDEELKYEYNCKVDILVHKARRWYPDEVYLPDADAETPKLVHQMTSRIRELIVKLALDIPEICNNTREELVMPPLVFDYLTRQGLTEQELAKYNKEQNNKKEEFLRKNKKTNNKKNVDEEEKEQTEFRSRFIERTKEAFLNLFNNFVEGHLKYTLKDKVLNSTLINENYIERLNRIKTYNMFKDHLESKIIVLRIDIEEYIKIEDYEEWDEEGNGVGNKICKDIIFPNAEKTFLESINTILGFNPKAVILLVDFVGADRDDPDLTVKHLEKFLVTNKAIEAPVTRVTDLSIILDGLEANFEDMMYQENTVFLIENINTFPQERGTEITEEGNIITLCEYSKYKFTKLLSAGSVYINDSPLGIMKRTPSIIDMKSQYKAIGKRLDSQLSKFCNFYFINSPNYMLIMGDIDIKYESQNLYYLQHLLIINSLLTKFKIICLMGKIGLVFTQFLQKDYIINKDCNISPLFYQLIKYILIRADLNGTEIILPTDIRTLPKGECAKLLESENQGIAITDSYYYKSIKDLYNRDKRQKRIERNHSEEELEEHNYYHEIKLKEEEIEILSHYSNNTVDFKSNDYIKPFIEVQDISKPKKNLKTPLDTRKFLEGIYTKSITFLEPVATIPTNVNNLSISHVSAKSMNKENLNNSEIIAHPSQIANKEREPYIFNTEITELVDYGEKTYLNMCQAISQSNCLMWLGKLSPTRIDNMFDSFSVLVESLNERKDSLVKRFHEIMEEEEKKLNEGDFKAKKFLFTTLVKCPNSYKLLRQSFKKFLEDRVQVEEDEVPEEILEDDDNFMNQMNHLVDFHIDEEYEFLNRILAGEHVPGKI